MKVLRQWTGSVSYTHLDVYKRQTYNMLKLSRQLFMFTGDAKYMDYYERAWYNQIAASVNDNRGNTYHIPLDGGSRKSYGNENLNGFTCCNGTAIETNTKLQDTIYFRAKDDSALYVNLYAPSTLYWNDSLTITQETNFPYEDTSKITINGSGNFDVQLRVPSWATNGYTLKVNGEVVDIDAVPGTYVSAGTTSVSYTHLDVYKRQPVFVYSSVYWPTIAITAFIL